MASEIRVDKITHTAGVGTITPSPTGVHIAGIVTGTTFSGSGASLTNLPAANLTGTVADARFPATLPAASGANLTSLPAGNLTGTVADARLSTVSSSKLSGALPALDGSALTGIGGTDFIHAEQVNVSGVTTSKAFVPTDQNLSHRNLIINGNMRVAQRGTSSTTSGMKTVDRWTINWSGGGVTQAQSSLTSGTPFQNGHANYLRVTNTSNTTTDTDYRFIGQAIEAQDLLNSGWNYKSSSSYITVSFWVRSSLAGTYNLWLSSRDSTTYYYAHPFTLVADTWTKVVKSIPGESNMTINNDTGDGMLVHVVPWYGTYYTTSGHTNNAWTTATSTDRVTDYAQNWANTSNATFDLTGVQMEVGESATPYEHKTHHEELSACQRYFYKIVGNDSDMAAFGFNYSSSAHYFNIEFPVPMRDYPTYTGSATDARIFANNIGQDFQLSSLAIVGNMTNAYPKRVTLYVSAGGANAGEGGLLSLQNAEGYLEFSSEI